MKQILLEGKQIGKTFAKDNIETEILRAVDIKIYEGDFTVIMGTSGAGKSTLLYALSGMDTITEGKVFYKGKKVSGLREKEQAKLRAREYGFVFQQTNLVSNLSLYENVAVAGYLAGKESLPSVEERALTLLSQMEMDGAKDRLPGQVSGGEAQRAAIARAVVKDPGILFADEPTGALNRAGSENVMDIFADLNREGQSILMVTHDIHAAARGNRILYLDDGKIIGEFALEEYEDSAIKERESVLNRWLESMSW